MGLCRLSSGDGVRVHYTERATANQYPRHLESPESILHINIKDIVVTSTLARAGKLLGVDVLDHLISRKRLIKSGCIILRFYYRTEYLLEQIPYEFGA